MGRIGAARSTERLRQEMLQQRPREPNPRMLHEGSATWSGRRGSLRAAANADAQTAIAVVGRQLMAVG